MLWFRSFKQQTLTRPRLLQLSNRGMGEPKSGLVNAIVVGLVNLVLDPLLMFGCGLGVAGAAIATATAQWVRRVSGWRSMASVAVSKAIIG